MEAEQALSDQQRDMELKDIKIESLTNIVKRKESQQITQNEAEKQLSKYKQELAKKEEKLNKM